jgi:hypothetical protein
MIRAECREIIFGLLLELRATQAIGRVFAVKFTRRRI